jgi:hypothetical protein
MGEWGGGGGFEKVSFFTNVEHRRHINFGYIIKCLP